MDLRRVSALARGADGPARVLIASDAARRTWRVISLLAVLLGLGTAAMGLVAPRVSADTEPRVLTPGVPTALPAPGLFGGRLVVLGNPVGERVPPGDAFGCRTVAPAGSSAVQRDQDGLAELDRLVVAGTAVAPVLVVHGRPPATLTCTGPAATSHQPMVVVARPGVDALVPMAAFSAASLLLILGLAGLVLLRPRIA